MLDSRTPPKDQPSTGPLCLAYPLLRFLNIRALLVCYFPLNCSHLSLCWCYDALRLLSAPAAEPKTYTYYGFARDRNLKRHKLMQQQRRACPNVRSVLTLRTEGTSQERSDLFYAAPAVMDEMAADKRPFMVRLAGIALPGPGGSEQLNDMLCLPATRVTAVVSCSDDSQVGVMMPIDVPKEQCAHYFGTSFGV